MSNEPGRSASATASGTIVTVRIGGQALWAAWIIALSLLVLAMEAAANLIWLMGWEFWSFSW